MRTKVKFVKDDTGEITAIFPEIKENNNCVLCYAHLGQHSAASRQWIKEKTQPAAEEEYSDLLKELQQQGYKNLKVIA